MTLNSNQTDRRIEFVFVVANLILASAFDCRASDLQQMAVSLVSEVGTVMGRDLRRSYPIDVLSTADFDSRTRKATNSPESRIPVRIDCYFCSNDQRIFIRGGLDGMKRIARNVSELELIEHLTIFHELVHAWQFEEAADAVRALALQRDVVVPIAILEGQAEWATERYARSKGYERLFLRMRQRFPAEQQMTAGGTTPDLYFRYVESSAFWTELHSNGKVPSLCTILTDRLPTDRQVIYPHEYLNGRTITERDLTGYSSLLGHVNDTQTRKIGLLGFRTYARTMTLSPQGLDRLLQEYETGCRMACHDDCQISALAFSRQSAASEMYRQLLKQHERSAKSPLHSRMLKGDIQCISYRTSNPGKTEFTTTTVALDDDVVWELNDYRRGSFEISWDDWLADIEKKSGKMRGMGTRKP